MRSRVLMFAAVVAALHAFSFPAPAQVIGPALEFSPPVVRFDTVSCGGSASAVLEIRNTGDAASTISAIDPVTAPFSGDFTAPLSIPPGNSIQVNFGYAPDRAPRRDSLVLNLVADNPVPTALGFLYDLSSGMAEAFGGDTRIAAAKAACSAFLDRAMSSAEAGHEGAVYGYSTTAGYRILRDFSGEKALLQGALPGIATGAHACAWDGMQRSITFIQNRQMRKILVVLTGSKDAGRGQCGPVSSPGVINSANAAGIAVYVIAFSDDDQSELQSVAQQTGGRYARVRTTGELETAFDAILVDLQYNVPQTLVLRGEAVAPELEFWPPHVLFPATRTGDTARVPLALHNTGTAPLHIRGVDGRPAAISFDLPAAVPPGDSAIVDVRFHPGEQAFTAAVLTLAYNACDSGAASIRMLGVGYEDVNPAPGAILAVSPDSVDFGTVSCDKTVKRIITLRNAGSTALQLASVNLGSQQFNTSPTNFNINPGTEAECEILHAGGAELGRHEGELQFLGAMRQSAAASVVLDLSYSMAVGFDGTISRAEAAQLALGELAAHMTSTPEVTDRLAVIAAMDSGTSVLQPLTQDQDAIASIAIRAGRRDSTCVADAVREGLDALTGAPGHRSMLILTALGDPDTAICGTGGFARLLRRSQDDDVAVSCFVLGDAAADSLAELCTGTGGMFRRVANLTQLRVAVAMFTAGMSAVGETTVPLHAVSVSSRPVILSDDPIAFTETRVGERRCLQVPIENQGEDTLVVNQVMFRDIDIYSLESPLPMRIDPLSTDSLRICFSPMSPGVHTDNLRLITNSCIYDTVNTRRTITASAWDSSAVLIDGTWHARPGSLVRIPLRMSRPLTAAYGLQRLEVTVAYNPTLLYPDTDFPLENASGASLLGSGYIRQDFDTAQYLATTRYVIRRGPTDPLTTTGAEFLLGYLRLRTFLGNEISTDVRIADVSAGELDFVLRGRGSATVAIDSMAWAEQRLLDPTALYGIALGKHSPNPVRDRALVTYRLEEPAQVRLALYDSFGRRVRTLEEGYASAGTHTLEFSAAGLAAGAYVYRLETGRGTVSRIMLITR